MCEPPPSSRSAAALESLYLELLRDRDALQNGIDGACDEAARAEMNSALSKLELLLAYVTEKLYATGKGEGQF